MTITLNGTTGITTPDVNVTAQSSNIVTTGNITAVDATLSGGVYVGGTGSANYLDDYEEGTWSPVVIGSSTSGTTTYSRQSGYYTKVGRLVTAWFDLGWSSHTGTGGLKISLPFAVSSTSYQLGAYISYNAGLSISTGYYAYGWADSGGSHVRVWQSNTSGSSASVPVDTSVPEFHMMITYNV